MGFQSRVFPGGVKRGIVKLPLGPISFDLPVLPLIAVAGVPGTPDPAAMGWLGSHGIEAATRIARAHIHQIKDGTGGSNDVELYRWRTGSGFTLIGTISFVFGRGDFLNHDFAITDPNLEAGDRLYAQATALLTGPGTAGTIDVHFDPVIARVV